MWYWIRQKWYVVPHTKVVSKYGRPLRYAHCHATWRNTAEILIQRTNPLDPFKIWAVLSLIVTSPLFFFSFILVISFFTIPCIFAEIVIESNTSYGSASEYHWTVAGSPYVITDGSITVPESEPDVWDAEGNLIDFTDYNGNGRWDSQMTLAIDAGVIVKLYNSDIIVQGNLALNSSWRMRLRNLLKQLQQSDHN